MRHAILVLHGYTMNGSIGASAERLLQPLGARLRVVAPDAPLECSEEAVSRFYQGTGLQRAQGPYRTWWRANEDNSRYEGWPETLASLRAQMREHAPVGVLGFSQGAMVAALIAALSARGELPALRFAILVAGRLPRARELEPLFIEPIELPSLHVWGERDAFSVSSAPELMERFAERTRRSFSWPAGHTLPTRGVAAQAIVDFVEAGLP
ncbi:MAG: alpha/beta fold hydrolase [Polyangiaceae bacterium]